MTCFMLPQTILNAPTEEDTHYPPVSLSSYIQNQCIHCRHECVNISQLVEEFKKKFKFSDAWIVQETLPSIPQPVILNHTDRLSLKEITMMTNGGTYISKLVDSTTDETIQFLFQLAYCFRNVCICKPDSVCSLSSIKYVIATDFMHSPKEGKYVIPYYFKMVIDEINSTYGQIQLEHLRYNTLSLGKI